MTNTDVFTCPRYQPGFKFGCDHNWREDRTCSYCGSLHPDDFLKSAEEGCEIVPTDKDYKAYIVIPNPNAGQPRIVGSANFEHPAPWVKVTADNVDSFPKGGMSARIGDWLLVGPTEKTKQQKFYWYHLNSDQQEAFIKLYNDKKLNIGYPGHFYTRPYFIRFVGSMDQ